MQGNNEDETEQSQTQPPFDEDSGEDKGEDKGDNKGEDKGENNGQDNANEVLWGAFTQKRRSQSLDMSLDPITCFKSPFLLLVHVNGIEVKWSTLGTRIGEHWECDVCS